MKNTESFIQYELSKSRTVQSAREKGIEMSWLKLEFFLRQFTTANPELPDDSAWDSIELHIFNGFDDQKSEDKCWTAITKANEKFGTGQIINVQQPQLYKSPPKKETIWRLKKENFKNAVDILISGDPWPKQDLGPIELVSFYKFKLKDIKTNEVLPRQTNESSIHFWLTRNSFCSPTINFPFEQPDDNFWDYVKRIERYFPFKFDPKNLRLGTRSKKGTGYKWSKL